MLLRVVNGQRPLVDNLFIKNAMLSDIICVVFVKLDSEAMQKRAFQAQLRGAKITRTDSQPLNN